MELLIVKLARRYCTNKRTCDGCRGNNDCCPIWKQEIEARREATIPPELYKVKNNRKEQSNVRAD